MPRSNLPAGHRRREGTHPLLEEGDGRVVDAVADRQLDAEMGLGGGYNQMEASELEGHLPVGAEEDEPGELVCSGWVFGGLHSVDHDPRSRVCSRGRSPERGEVLRENLVGAVEDPNPQGAHPTLVVEIRIGQVEGKRYRVLARSDGLEGALGDDEGGLAVGEGRLEDALRVERLVQQAAATADDRRVAEGAGDRFGDAVP